MRLVPFLLLLALAGLPPVPAAARPAKPAASRKAVPPRVGSALYRVRRGDTAARIARAHGLTLQQLADLNPETDLARLTVGRSLRVKGRPEPRPAPSASPLGGLPALPAVPPRRPMVLVHLERLVPALPSARSPEGAGSPAE